MGSKNPGLRNQAFVADAENSKGDDHNIQLVYVEPNCNQVYECIPNSAAKPAELNLVSSASRKMNQLESITKFQQVPLPDKPSWPNNSTESSHLAATAQPELEELKMRKCDEKLVIFLVFVLCLSLVALALGLVNVLKSRGMRSCNFARKNFICYLSHI